jgi:hypothetical protein
MPSLPLLRRPFFLNEKSARGKNLYRTNHEISRVLDFRSGRSAWGEIDRPGWRGL